MVCSGSSTATGQPSTSAYLAAVPEEAADASGGEYSFGDGAGANDFSAGDDVNVEVGELQHEMHISHLTQDVMQRQSVMHIDPKKANLPNFSE